MGNDLNDELLVLKASGMSQDEILKLLFVRGVPIAKAIVAIRALYAIKLEEAKQVVSRSSHWSETHRANQSLHEKIEIVAESED